MFPWEYSREFYIYHGYTSGFYRGGGGHTITYSGIKEYLNDNSHQVWRKGDIVKFNNRLVQPYHQNWTDWFATLQDRKRFWNVIPEIARYADQQLAIIIGRFRKIKMKYSTFIDYGVVTMMLTGPKPGKIRHYWTTKPFKKKCVYPNKIKFKYMLNTIPPEVVEIYNQDREDTNESRNQMLHEIYRIFHKE